MLSEATMVRVRKAMERTYTGFCSAVVNKKVLSHDKSTQFREVHLFEGQACYFSHGKKSATEEQGMLSELTLEGVVFLPPELDVPPGTKLVVEQAGRTLEFSSSGQSAVYHSHQEIAVTLFKGWA